MEFVTPLLSNANKIVFLLWKRKKLTVAINRMQDQNGVWVSRKTNDYAIVLHADNRQLHRTGLVVNDKIIIIAPI